jgi:hypothetical protein
MQDCRMIVCEQNTCFRHKHSSVDGEKLSKITHGAVWHFLIDYQNSSLPITCPLSEFPVPCLWRWCGPSALKSECKSTIGALKALSIENLGATSQDGTCFVCWPVLRSARGILFASEARGVAAWLVNAFLHLLPGSNQRDRNFDSCADVRVGLDRKRSVHETQPFPHAEHPQPPFSAG